MLTSFHHCFTVTKSVLETRGVFVRAVVDPEFIDDTKGHDVVPAKPHRADTANMVQTMGGGS